MAAQLLITRLAQAVVVFFGVSLVVFVLVRVIPGDPVRIMIGDQATEEQIQATRSAYGLDQPLPVQYWLYLRDMLGGDLGESLRQRQPVSELLLEALPATMQLAAAAGVLSVVVGIPIGILSAAQRGTLLDRAVMMIALVGQAMPTFWWGVVLILVFSVTLHLLPTSGAGTAAQLVLPAVTLSTYITALIARLTRSAMIDVLGQDYIRTGRSKGLTERRILLIHALKNASIPVATVLALQFGNMIGGAVITETVFAWPGIGTLALNAVTNRDYPVLQGVVLLSALAFLAINVCMDIVYVYLDPRIRYN